MSNKKLLKKNMIIPKVSDQFDSFYFNQSRLHDMSYDYYLKREESDISAVCISGLITGQNNGGSNLANDARYVEINGKKHLSLKVRRKNIEGTIRPHPKTSAQDVSEQQFLVGMHETAISDKPMENGMASIPPGTELRCYYTDGRAFGLPEKTLMFRSSDIGSDFINNFAVGFGEFKNNVAGFFDNSQNLQFVQQYENTKVVKSSVVYSLEGYRFIASLLNDNVLLNIRQHESADNPFITNYGTTKFAQTFPEWENLTVSDIAQIHATGILGPADYRRQTPRGLKKPFALGLYQIIPKTLKFIISTVPEVQSLKFNRDTQQILGTILVMNKRPVMGNYILGKHDNVVQAGQNWAYEWAYAPSQYDTKRGKVFVPAGNSYYSGTGGNRAGTAPSTIRSELQKARAAVEPFRDKIKTLTSISNIGPQPG